ncbi:MAG TPA: heparan-alpha-glucosaminide N-acetyltransferase domain-containing protein [Terracidiphilus sp.]|jgi:predicted acyltransferase|nr:heparan-alpha-glucosaminide N-acetyltransferase domain-containing protein [Terracidiphilus sp.]
MSTASTSPSPIRRFISLDVARGITIAFMIMVNNNGGSGSWGFMNHAHWNGLTPTDLVFPTFLFIVGVSIVFSTEARLAKGAPRAQLAKHTIQRAAILFLFGVILNGFPFFHLEHYRIYGVLQRIAFCYLVVGLFYLWDNRASTKVAALVAALVGYWAILRFVPIPGIGTPGTDVPFMDITRNLTSWIDRGLMPHHLYLDWPDHNTRDPEGLLSDLPSLGTALMGVLTGLWLRTGRSVSAKALGLAAASIGSLLVGYLWSLEFPLNKNMWTSSFVLVAGGYSLSLLALCFWAVEVRGWSKGWTWPWLVFGSNAIAAYVFSELTPSLFEDVKVPAANGAHQSLGAMIFHNVFAHIPDPGWAAFGWSVSYAAFCFIPVWILYRKKIFLKV